MTSYRMSQRTGQHSPFVFRKSWVQIFTRGLAILTDIFRSFSQLLQANVGLVHHLRNRRHPFTLLLIHYSLYSSYTVQYYVTVNQSFVTSRHLYKTVTRDDERRVEKS